MRFYEHLIPRLASLANNKCRSEPRMLTVVRAMERTAETLYRGVWEKAALERHRLGETVPAWEYLPSNVWTGIMQDYICPGCGHTKRGHIHHGTDSDSFQAEATLFAVAMTAAWRATRTVYKIDETLVGELLATPMEYMPPAEALLYLPDWCIVADFPEPVALQKRLMLGYMAQPYLGADGKTIIVAIMTTLTDGQMVQEPCILSLSAGSHDCVSFDDFTTDALWRAQTESTRERYRAYATENGLRHPGDILRDEIFGRIPPTGLTQCSFDGLLNQVLDMRTIAIAVFSSMLYIASPLAASRCFGIRAACEAEGRIVQHAQKCPQNRQRSRENSRCGRGISRWCDAAASAGHCSGSLPASWNG